MDADQVAMLREVLSATGWLERTRRFARTLRTSTRDPGGLLLLGGPQDEPWHLAAHLDDESRFSGLPQLMPTLVRWAPPPNAPAHLRVGLERLAAARRGETLFVVAEEESAPVSLLERVDDARRTGAVILSLDGGDKELRGLAHESLTVPPRDGLISFDGAQHLVSAAAGEAVQRRHGEPKAGRRPTVRDRLATILDAMSGARPD